MRTQRNKVVVAIAATTLLFTAACHKNEDPVTGEEIPDKPKQEIVATMPGVYRITKVEGAGSGQRNDITETWYRSYAGDCAKDDLTTFKPDGSFVVQDGTIECDESTDDTGTWKVLSATKLKIDQDTALIETFNATTLRIVSPVYSSAQGDIIFTYTRQ